MLFRGRLFSRPAAEHSGGGVNRSHGSTRTVKNEKVEYYDKEFMRVLRLNMSLSQTAWHKVMHPNCGECAYERGKRVMHGEVGRVAVIEIDSESPAKTHLG